MSRRLKIRPSHEYIASDSNKNSKRKFDVDSGQVYTEVTCRVGPMSAEWVWKTKGSTWGARSFRSIGPGCASLENMAIRSVVTNSSSLTAEAMQDIPWLVGQKIWLRMRHLRLDSVHTWKAFASTYPGVINKCLNHRCHVIEEPDIPMDAYIKPLVSPSFHWIVHLTVSNLAFSRAEIAGLSRLVNLGALTIGNSPTGTFLDDGIIRAWARAATEVGAFSMLRVLILKAQKEITPQSFAYLNQLPSLALFNTENCNLGPSTKVEALALGWKYRTGKDLTDFLIEGGLTNSSWDSTVRALFRQAGAYNADHFGQESVEAIDLLPVLHFCLGRPPGEAALELTTNERMRCFQRICQKKAQSHIGTVKRPLCDEQDSSTVPAKKPRVRISKLKDFGDLLTGFGA